MGHLNRSPLAGWSRLGSILGIAMVLGLAGLAMLWSKHQTGLAEAELVRMAPARLPGERIDAAAQGESRGEPQRNADADAATQPAESSSPPKADERRPR